MRPTLLALLVATGGCSGSGISLAVVDVTSDAPLTVAQIYQAVRPSVVLIRATGGETA